MSWELRKMASLFLQNGWSVLLCVLYFSSFICEVKATSNTTVIKDTVFIDGRSPISKTNENFICATIDWWPPQRCDNGTCSWGNASLLNLDLKNIVLLNAVKAFSPLMVRLGGTLQDQVIYQTEGDPSPCIPFAVNSSQLHNFTKGCLSLARWDEINSFVNQSRALITFGLNALNGKTIGSNNIATGPWNSTNAASFLRYTAKKGYNVYGWELGNELGGRVIEVGVGASPYASDTAVLHNLIQEIYKGVNIKPHVLAPGGLFESNWYKHYIAISATSLDVITHHIYNLGSGSVEQLIQRILDPSFLDGGIDVFKRLQKVLKNSKTSIVSWVSESGGIYNSGRYKVSNTFVSSFWYLDQLGFASVYGTKTYCRQALIGGNYGLLNTTTFVPNPDYYSALLWHRLMGRHVLRTKFTGTRMIRAYAHCAKHSQGITVLLINLDGNTTVHAALDFNSTSMKFPKTGKARREEYHLTPIEGNIQSQTVLLNGKALSVDSSGAMPSIEPVTVNTIEPIRVAPYSIAFVHMPNVHVPACEE